MTNDEDPDFSALIRAHATRFPADAQLRSAIQADLLLHSAARVAPPPASSAHRTAWSLILGAVVGGVLTALALSLVLIAQSEREQLRGELIAGHVRSLMDQHLTDIASADRHTVKPWFQGKLDFAPPVRDFADDGYPLVGARLDYVAARPVAALVYRHEKHVINVFVWPDAPQALSRQIAAIQGYNLTRWSSDGMQFWAVSDLNERSLNEFARLWTQAAGDTRRGAP